MHEPFLSIISNNIVISSNYYTISTNFTNNITNSNNYNGPSGPFHQKNKHFAGEWVTTPRGEGHHPVGAMLLQVAAAPGCRVCGTHTA